MTQHPGQFIEHHAHDARAIVATSTCVTAFVGHVRRGTPVTRSGGRPVFITSAAQYTTLFGPGDGSAGGVKKLPLSGGKTVPDAFGLAISAYFANGGTKAYIVPLEGSGGEMASATLSIGGVSQAMVATAKSKGSWANGLRVELLSDHDNESFDVRIGTWKPGRDGTAQLRDKTIEHFAGFAWDGAGTTATERRKAALEKAAERINAGSTLVDVVFGDGIAMPETDATVAAVLTGGADTDAPARADYSEAFGRLEACRDVSIIVLPDVSPDANGKSIYHEAIGHAEKMRSRMVIVDPGAEPLSTQTEAKTAMFTASPCAAFYYPRVEVANPHFDEGRTPDTPPSFTLGPAGHVAGLWARTDAARGVWKAPAGLEASLRGVLAPERRVGHAVQDILSERGINCLRPVAGSTVVWGARTAAATVGSDDRYIPVRRTRNMIRESLEVGLQAFVFEPNNEPLWDELKGSIGDFLDGLFRSGAFQGETASDAYFVNCGLGSTMTQADIDAGILRVAVGFAPLKPAEFVVIEVSRKIGQVASRRPPVCR